MVETVCPSCGAANPRTYNFCRRCYGLLPGAEDRNSTDQSPGDGKRRYLPTLHYPWGRPAVGMSLVYFGLVPILLGLGLLYFARYVAAAGVGATAAFLVVGAGCIWMGLWWLAWGLIEYASGAPGQ